MLQSQVIRSSMDRFGQAIGCVGVQRSTGVEGRKFDAPLNEEP